MSSTPNYSVVRLKRRDQVQEYKRQKGLPVFNLDARVGEILQSYTKEDLKLSNYYPAPLRVYYPATYGLPYKPCNCPQCLAVSTPSATPSLTGPQPSIQAQPVTVQTAPMLVLKPATASVQHSSYFTKNSKFPERLAMSEEYENVGIVSPYSLKTLKPYIYRDAKTRPLRLRFLEEVVSFVQKKQDPQWVSPSPATIDYSHIRPQHVRQINDLLQAEFWPGIDLTECLDYPEFSVVALYKKLVIGCGFITPMGYVSYIAVHPEWRRAGLARVILFHLVQAVPTRDVTLHVSPSNPAMLLYQTFCFKTEQMVKGYYNGYYPLEHPSSRNACFMRFKR